MDFVRREPGALVKVVDVLRDAAVEALEAMQPGQRQVRGVRLGAHPGAREGDRTPGAVEQLRQPTEVVPRTRIPQPYSR